MISEASFHAFLSALDAIVEASYRAKSLEEFRELIEQVDEWLPKTDAHYLLDAVRSAVLLNKHAVLTGGNEFDLHAKFREELPSLLTGWYIISRQNDRRHIPDFWVKRPSGEEAPVEIKLDVFSPAALRQLERYMAFYGCAQGFAVAPKLTCKLPGNIRFLPLSL